MKTSTKTSSSKVKKRVHFASPVVTDVVIIPRATPISTELNKSRPNHSFLLTALSHPVTKLVATILILGGLAALSAITFNAVPVALGLTTALISFASGAGLFRLSDQASTKRTLSTDLDQQVLSY